MGWAGLPSRAGQPGREEAAHWVWGWGGAGLAVGFLEPGTTLKRKSFEDGEVVFKTEKTELPDGQQQQAISIYFFLESVGFRVWGLGFGV